MKYPIKYFYFPNSVLLVDDNSFFLSNLKLALPATVSSIICDNPIQALAIINANAHLPYISVEKSIYNSNVEYDEGFAKLISVNFDLLHKIIYDKNRFSNISTVLVDYSMPQMNGIDFCKSISNSNLRKIMVSGTADHKIAVDGFNDGVIERFVIKSPDMFNQLNLVIKEEQEKYFLTASELLFGAITNNLNKLLKNINFIEIFEAIFLKVNAVEYYLLDENGSFLFLDENGRMTILAVMPESQLDNYIEIAKDSGASADIVNRLENNNILFLFTEENHNLSPNKWSSYLFPAKHLEVEENYYFSIIPHTEAQKFFDTKAVIPYSAFLETNVYS